MNVIIVTVASLLILLTWLLLSPFIIAIDTRVPAVELRWISIGTALLWYEEDEWKLKFNILFYKKELLLKNIHASPKKKKVARKKEIKGKDYNIKKMLAKVWSVVKSFNVLEWKISIDTGDNSYNAQLYPLNFMLPAGHLNINFNDESYFTFRVKNSMLRVIWAWIK